MTSNDDVNEFTLAKDCVKKKLGGLKEMPIEKKRGRMAQFLARKGFNAVVIYSVLEQLLPDSQDISG